MNNMETQTITDFDRILLDLEEKVQEHPEEKEAVIRRALMKVGCPYLIEKYIGVDYREVPAAEVPKVAEAMADKKNPRAPKCPGNSL